MMACQDYDTMNIRRLSTGRTEVDALVLSRNTGLLARSMQGRRRSVQLEQQNTMHADAR